MAKPRVLMFGWEFPPFNAGGLGVACYGLIKGLSRQGIEVIFVLPKKVPLNVDFCRVIFADENPADLKTFYSAYSTLTAADKNLNAIFKNSWGLIEEVKKYALLARQIAKREKFDIIHAHDWLCYPAGLMAKEVSGKPLVVHIHATEFDRTGGLNVNSQVYAIEKEGFEKADKIVAVSNFTKQKVAEHYDITPSKISVVYNALEKEQSTPTSEIIAGLSALNKKFKMVLFLGRLTLQKGPDYFLQAAKKVLEKNPNVYFVIAGSGDMQHQLINQTIDLDIADKVIFTGFLRDRNLAKIYQMADLYVMPSVSEPFGITALEALNSSTPIIISKQSGVSEIIKNCLRVDFWDINQMANKMLAVLNYPALGDTLKECGKNEVEKITWDNSASACLNVYNSVLSNS